MIPQNKLQSVGALPNVTVAFPGEVWSRGKASGTITPGTAVLPVSSGGKEYVRAAASGECADPRCGVALRVVEIPDVNTGPSAKGPNEIVNTDITTGEYVRRYTSGAFHLTLLEVRDDWAPGDLVYFDPAVARSGKTGNGAWRRTTNLAIAFAEVLEFRRVATNQGVLTVRSLRSQF